MSLNLEPSPHRKVFRTLVDALKRDPVLRSVVRRWITWGPNEGDPWRDPVDGELPCLELRPSVGPDSWHGPSAFEGPLWVDLVVTVAGTDADCALDLYEAVKRALYPRDEAAKLAIHRALVEAGATHHFGVRFMPAEYAPVAGGTPEKPLRRMIAGSRLAVDVVDELNP